MSALVCQWKRKKVGFDYVHYSPTCSKKPVVLKHVLVSTGYKYCPYCSKLIKELV